MPGIIVRPLVSMTVVVGRNRDLRRRPDRARCGRRRSGWRRDGSAAPRSRRAACRRPARACGRCRPGPAAWAAGAASAASTRRTECEPKAVGHGRGPFVTYRLGDVAYTPPHADEHAQTTRTGVRSIVASCPNRIDDAGSMSGRHRLDAPRLRRRRRVATMAAALALAAGYGCGDARRRAGQPGGDGASDHRDPRRRLPSDGCGWLARTAGTARRVRGGPGERGVGQQPRPCRRARPTSDSPSPMSAISRSRAARRAARAFDGCVASPCSSSHRFISWSRRRARFAIPRPAGPSDRRGPAWQRHRAHVRHRDARVRHRSG